MAATLADRLDYQAILKKQREFTTDRATKGSSGNDTLYGDDVTYDKKGNVLISVNDRISGGNGDDALYGGVGGDFLSGGDGNDILNGGSGKDLMVGGAGADSMYGGTDTDTYLVDDAADQIFEVDEKVSKKEVLDTVISSVDYTLSAHVDILVLTGSAAINATGNTLNNILAGNSGINTLTGGDGNDDYYVQNTGDTVKEQSSTPGKEWNRVFSTVSFTLTPGNEIDELVLLGKNGITASGNELNNLIEGNAGANRLYGGDGEDTLGGVTLTVEVADDYSRWSFITAHLGDEQGRDVLYGGAGNDEMFLGKLDRAVENPGEGVDRVVCGFSHNLEDNVEILDFYGALGSSEALTGKGNELHNWIVSNLGADTLIGKTGDDVYEVFNSAVKVTERNGEGNDAVLARVDYRLPNNVENLTLSDNKDLSSKASFSGKALNGLGNSLDNQIIGNKENNALDGQAGNDTLYGNLGNDQLTGGLGSDAFVFDTALDVEKNLDLILDFRPGEDKIMLNSTVRVDPDDQLSPFIFNLAKGALQNGINFEQGAGVTATLANAEILFDTVTGTLSYDADGAASGKGIPFAILYPIGLPVTNTDFLIF